MKLFFGSLVKLPLFILAFVTLISCSTDTNDTKPKVKLTPLQSCLKEVERSNRSCVLMSFGGMSSFRQNPKFAAECRVQKFEETKWCYKQFK